jgi:hypothetical protein
MERYKEDLPDILGRIGGEFILGRRGLGQRTYLYEQRAGALGYVITQYDLPAVASRQSTLHSWLDAYR